MRRLLTLLLLVIGVIVSARSDVRPMLRLLPAANDTAVWLVTIYPGEVVYQLEGHTALAVQIPGRQTRAYNFGVFDFKTPNFLWRFVTGQTDYMAVNWPYDAFMYEYVREGRRAVAQKLNLTAAQTAQLVNDLDSVVLPQNCKYRYNYVKDNCATRPLRAIERVVGDSLCLGAPAFVENSSSPMTFRNIMRYYHRNYPWYQFGIDLALGSGVDYELEPIEAAFAPVELESMIAKAKVGDKDFVSETVAVIDLPEDYAVQGPTPWWETPMAVFSALFLLTLGITVRDVRHKEVSRWFDTVLFTLLGLEGCSMAFLIFVSVHEATSPNWLFLWLNPLCLLVPILIWLKKCKKVLMCYQIVNFAVLLVLSGIWCFLPQSANIAFLPILGAEMMRSAAYIYINKR